MVNEGDVDVESLIVRAERAMTGRERSAIYAALAEAGGEAAQAYLSELARYEKSDTKKAKLIKLSEKASRV
ncbi:hypothetical protein [Pseudomonas kitaguniensis]|uniref:hypothetical protein n=1 Tax=Pseudomonas kitaguniensis TaxID=2607908 RepID=UPI003CFE0B06